MNFRFHNLLAAPYRGGSLAMHGDTLLSPVGNRVAQVRRERFVSSRRRRAAADGCAPPAEGPARRPAHPIPYLT